MSESSNGETFISVKNGSEWWVSVGLTQFVSIVGHGPLEDGQTQWVAPTRDTREIKIAIAEEGRPTPLLVGTAAGLFSIYHRPTANQKLVEIVMESSGGGQGTVISNDASSLGLWHLLIGADGVPSAEHEVVG